MNDDHALVAGIAKRDPEAFRTLMERYAAAVINVAYRFVGTVADAEEMTQDVFLKLYQHPPRLDPAGKLFTWLYRVTVNRCLDLLRQNPRSSATISLDAPLGDEGEGFSFKERIPDSLQLNPRDQVIQRETVLVTRRAIANLPTGLRVPLILSTFEQLSQQEIGQILKVSPKAVERRIARARDILKQRLAAYL